MTGNFTYDSTTALRSLTVPALYVRAAIPVDLDRLPAGVHRAEVPGVGHWAHVHAPGPVNALVDEFLTRAVEPDRLAAGGTERPSVTAGTGAEPNRTPGHRARTDGTFGPDR